MELSRFSWNQGLSWYIGNEACEMSNERLYFEAN